MKNFEDVLIFKDQTSLKVFRRLCKDLSNLFIEMNKLEILKNIFKFSIHVDANQKPLDLSFIALSQGLTP